MMDAERLAEFAVRASSDDRSRDARDQPKNHVRFSHGTKNRLRQARS
jgi:hypothetical protein